MSALEPFRKGPTLVRAESGSPRQPVYVHIEEAARRCAERLRNTPPQPAPTPPAPIPPPVEQYPEPEPRSLIADIFTAVLTLISRRTP